MRTSKNMQNSGLTTALVLVASAAGLAYLTTTIWGTRVDTSPIGFEVPAATDGGPKQTAIGGEAGRTTQAGPLTETTARPLFTQLRRPVTPPKPKVVEQVAQPPAAPLQAQLVGLVNMANNGGRALIRNGSDRNGTWLSVGEEMAGWRLSEISGESVVLESGVARQELRLLTVRAARQQQ